MKCVSGIYCIENLTNNKKYIGQSTDIYKRWKGHKTMLKHNSHHNIHLQRAYNKYGKECFIFYIIKCCKHRYLNRFEKLYIKKYNTFNDGYNSTKGGDIAPTFSGLSHTQDTKNTMSEIKKEQYKGKGNPMYGKNHSINSKLQTSKKLSTSGIYRVIKHKTNNKQGFRWEYYYFDSNNKKKYLSSINLDKLKQRVLAKGLPWIEF